MRSGRRRSAANSARSCCTTPTILSSSPWWDQLCDVPGFVSRKITPADLVRSYGAKHADLMHRLAAPALKSDILRSAIVAAEGGVYLDLDTVTVQSMRDCLQARAFIGLERIVWPAWLEVNRKPWSHPLSQLRSTIRNLLRIKPHGWKLFRKIERFYCKVPNAAVFGAEVGHPLVLDILERMLHLSLDSPLRCAFGPHLYQYALREKSYPGLRVYEPEVFHLLPTEISEHWFRISDHIDLRQALTQQTKVVHWYASVRTKEIVPNINPGFVRENSDRQLFSCLVRPYANAAVTGKAA